MAQNYTAEELNKLGQKELVGIVLSLQEQVGKLNDNLERLIEQIRIANSNLYGRKTERLDQLAGQYSLFDEAEAYAEEKAEEPGEEEVIITVRKKKKSGQREEDVKDLPREPHDHLLTNEQLDNFFGKGCWRRMKQDKYIRVRCQPAVYTVEDHTVDVAVGIKGDHQDEFLRGDYPDTLFRSSIATASLEAAIINAKYVNRNPLDRVSRDFKVNGLNLSKQTISNWTVWSAERFLRPVYDLMKIHQLEAHVNQCDETPLEVIHDGRPAGSKSYMWVHITGELSPVPKIIVYEYQKTRHSDHPKEYYREFNGILMTDGLEQYHKLAREQEGIVNANCFAHARRHFANAIKAMGKGNQKAVESSVAYKALMRIGAIYKLEESLKTLSLKERLKERQSSIRPLVEEYFAWVKEVLASGAVLPKSETAKGLNYSINQEEYLKVFLADGEVPIDDSASERALRNFTIGRKNWVTINTIRGAQASAIIYSITETARANNLNVYYYIRHLLTEIPRLVDKNENISQSILDPLMPWSKNLPADCYSKRRK